MSDGHIKVRKLCEVLVQIAALLIIAQLAVNQLSEPLKLIWDDAMYLEMARKLLAGQILYSDFTDVNPPMVIYMSILPVLLAQALGVHVIVIFKLAIVALNFLSYVLCWTIVRRKLSSDDHWPYLNLLLLLTAAASFITGIDFGQREHIFVLCYLPFFFLRWYRWQGFEPINKALSILTGCLAAVGICLKPTFLFVTVLTELYWFATAKRWKALLQPESISFALTGIVYALHFFFLPVSAQAGIIDVASNIWLFQRVFNHPLSECLKTNPFYLLVFLLALFFRTRYSLIMPLLCFAVGGWLSFIIQSKGWTYHRLPMLTASLMLFWVEMVTLGQYLFEQILKVAGVSDDAKGLFRARGDLVFCCLVFGLCTILGISVISNSAVLTRSLRIESPAVASRDSSELKQELTRLAHNDAMLDHLLKYSDVGDHVIVLNSILYPAYPACVQSGRIQSTRYPYIFPIMEFEYAQREASKQGDSSTANIYKQKEKAVLETILVDAKRYNPKLIILRQPSTDETSLPFPEMSQGNFLDKLLADYKKIETFTDRNPALPKSDQAWQYTIYTRAR